VPEELAEKSKPVAGFWTENAQEPVLKLASPLLIILKQALKRWATWTLAGI
jgi:hypothetical protein